VKSELLIQHTGTLGDQDRTTMTFDENSIAHLMSILTDLYSDPKMAVIREYSTNALDSHAAAGVTRPIEVELPTPLRQTLVIRDFGTGMSLDTITNQFSKYGWSSKRETNEQVGMLGLGCKSALSYTAQFTMVSNHNGLKITVLVTRTPDGAGAVQIVDTTPTEDANGVEVRVPANEWEFADKARWFFGFWEPGTVLLDNEEPKRHVEADDALELDPDVHVIASFKDSYVVMGNVPYVVKRGALFEGHNYNNENGVVARVPIGSVNFTPSREQLHYTKLTDATIATVRDFVRERMLMRIEAAINDAPTYHEAWVAYRNFSDMVRLLGYQHSNRRFTYRGSQVPNVIYFDGKRTLSFPVSKPGSWTKDESNRVDHQTVDHLLATTALFVVGSQSNHVPAATKERVRKYCGDNGIEKGRIIMVPKLPEAQWFESIPTVDYDTIKKIVVPNSQVPKSVVQRTGWYTVLDSSANVVATDLAAVTSTWLRRNLAEPLCWIPAGDECPLGGDKQGIVNFVGEYVVANVPKRSEERFQREFPNVPTFKEFFIKIVNGMVASASPWDRFVVAEREGFYQANHYYPDNILDTRMKVSEIDDPEIVDLLRLCVNHRNHGLRSRWTLAEKIGNQLGVPLPEFQPSGVIPRLAAVAKRYPLLQEVCCLARGSHYAGEARDIHLYQYLNETYLLREQLHLIPVL